jgi:2,3-bisphosphoglycerate-independent phosphoglycerate mutase
MQWPYTAPMPDTPSPAHAPLVLIIRDGWGENPDPEQEAFNAVRLAQTPIADELMSDWPHTLIKTCGEDVGLPSGTMGNSEVGHQNIGAGRIVDQEAVRISKAAGGGKFSENEALTGAIGHAKKGGGAVHLMGLCSDAGVHALLEHLYACLDLSKSLEAPRVYVHCFTDGRDTGPFTGRGFLKAVAERCETSGAQIASVIGRYWAMDRDNRWERVARAYACLTGRDVDERGVKRATSSDEAVRIAYDNPPWETMRGDEFIEPTMVGESDAERDESRIRDGDTVIFFNYRGDRPRELVRAFVLPEFQGHVAASPDSGEKGFDRGKRLDVRFVCMTAYAQDILDYVDVAFPKPAKLENILGQCVSDLGLTQFRCAETEKFPHVTFFFNDYRDEPFPGEKREIIQSPKVATYDMQPEMSAEGVRDAVLARLEAKDCEPLIVVNFANPDMVGHTGSLEATIEAVQWVDECVGAIIKKTLAIGGCAIVTADHGNAEQMWDPENNSPHTSHTTYDVPLIVAGEPFRERTLRDGGRLADIAPTALDMLGLDKPHEMTGTTLLNPAE